MKISFKSIGNFFKEVWSSICFFFSILLEAPITIAVIVFISFMIWFVVQRTKSPVPDNNYRNFDMIVVDMGRDISTQNTKPTLCMTILLETTKAFELKFDTTHLYREINTCDEKSEGFHIDTKWYYNHQNGDTIHFERMLKSEFFKSSVLDKKLNK
jgi:hypothetical protein